jgi:hypothetical protein
MANATLPVRAVKAPVCRKPRLRGAIVWRGESPFDGERIVAVITGLDGSSENPKTGKLAQLWILPENELPSAAVKAGRDGCVCGRCPMRAAERRELGRLNPGMKLPACYVTTNQAPDQVWRSVQGGTYPDASRDGAVMREVCDALVNGPVQGLRLGAYGDPGFVPLELLSMFARRMRAAGKACTGYTHQWAEISPDYRRFLMASASHPEERERARSMGWRVFRVRQEGEHIRQGERVCPASDEYAAAHGGRKVSCAECGACHGTGANDTQGMADLVILDHGPTSQRARDKQRAGMVALRMV